MNLEIPKNVREALQRQVPREAHPAADLLNAYAERLLSASEDALVAGHLASCRDCREIVFLAESAIDSPVAVGETMAPEPSRLSWWRWLMPATALAAIAGAVLFIEQPWQKEAAPQEARTISPAAPPAAKDAAPASKPAAKAVIPESATRRDHSTPPAHVASVTSAPHNQVISGGAVPAIASAQPAAGKVVGGLLTSQNGKRESRGLPDYQGQQQNSNIAFSGPSARMQNSPGPQATAITNGNADVYGPVLPPAAAPDVNASADAISEAKINSRTKPALQFNFAGSAGQRRNPVSRMAIQFWRITSDGHVEHFIQNSWNRALGGVQKSFRVVAYLQNHVWAGGVGPELYHSSDNGQTWDTTRVRSIDAELSGTMQSIRALDEKHVAIVADDGSLWVTNDGGKTWDKQ